MDSEMAEAAVQLCHMIDRETDAAVPFFFLLFCEVRIRAITKTNISYFFRAYVLWAPRQAPSKDSQKNLPTVQKN